MDPQLKAAHTKLKTLRTRTDLKLRPTKHLKDTFTDFDGREKPLVIRYYQVQGILHLVVMKRFVLGDDTGLGKCCTHDTLLPTDRGLVTLGSLAPKPLDQLVPGQFYDLVRPTRVWTGQRWAEVRRFYFDGFQQTKRITTETGLRVEGSLRHPLKVRSARGADWVRTPDIQIGDRVCVDRRTDTGYDPSDPDIPFSDSFAANAKEYQIPSTLTPELARLLGYIVAEGHSPNKYSTTVTQYDPEAHADIRGLFESVFGWVGNQHSKDKDISIEVTSVQIWAFLACCGVRPGLSAEKQVPPLVLQGSRESLREFLRGYFEGGGGVIEAGIEASSASENLLRQVQLVLLRFGIVSVLAPKPVKGRNHLYWRLTIFGDDARKFLRDIGFVTRRKQVALREQVAGRVSNPNRDTVPGVKSLVEALRVEMQVCAPKGFSTRWGSSFYNTLGHIRRGHREATYSFLRMLLAAARDCGVPEDIPEYQAVQDLVDEGYFYDRVVKIEDGYAAVMDIEVDDPDHQFSGNGFINHNTLETIAALCYVWEQEPDRKAVILTTKSAAKQWANEFGKFTRGVKVFVGKGTPVQRAKARDAFLAADGPSVLIMGYRSAVMDISAIQDWKDFILITDEATVYKNAKTQVHQACRHLAAQASRVWALTATLIKNHLMEGFGIYQVVRPGLFRDGHDKPMSYNNFMLYFCLTRMQSIPHSNRQVPVIVGYLPGKVQEFRDIIDPYFIGRPKHAVAKELPALIQRTIEVEMTAAQEAKYADALSGLLALGDDDEADVKEVSKLTAISYCQEIVNHLALINCEGESGKLETLVEMLGEGGEFEDEKVIIFSRFKRLIDIVMDRLAKEKIKAVRVTGGEDEDQREDAKVAFQNPDSDVRVCCITTAGSESINLQAAKALVCYDTPWSAGDFLQLVGRMIRIGSVHDRCYVVHLVAKGEKCKTVDHRIMEVMGKKMDLLEAVLGKRLKGEKDAPALISAENDLSDLYNALREDAKEVRRT